MSEQENIDYCLAKLKNLYNDCSQVKKESIITSLKRLVEDTNNEDISTVYVELDCVDEMTMLPNRETLTRDISILKDEAMLIILHINHINILKELNGVDIIKNIIREKATQLHDVIQLEEATLYNLCLGEFAILIPEKRFFEKYLSILEYSIFNHMDKDIYKNSDGSTTVLDFTAGIAYSDVQLLHRADVVLQEAILTKKAFMVYKKTESATDEKQLTLDRLSVYKQALYDGKIIPYFQAILDSTNEKIMKYEALARLETDDGEIVTPYYFLNSAIEDKTFEYFTRQMMQKVFNVYAKTDIDISLNITYENMVSETMLNYIKNRLDKYGGEKITFEILESEEIKDYHILEDFIVMVKEYGCKISIDDFGSGYSNFTNIMRLNIDFIKIDGTLIENLNVDKKVYMMVQGLVDYAQRSNIQTIAEFVSSKEIADTVKELGIDYMQGFYYGEPKSAKSHGFE